MLISQTTPDEHPRRQWYYVYGHSGCAHSDIRSLNTTIVKGPIKRHYKSPLAYRWTWHGFTGIYMVGKLGLDRIVDKMVARAPCRCTPEGSFSTGHNLVLVRPQPFTLSGNVVNLFIIISTPKCSCMFRTRWYEESYTSLQPPNQRFLKLTWYLVRPPKKLTLTKHFRCDANS